MPAERGVASEAGPEADAEYFQAVEEFFVSRRGDPLFLSSADWFLVWKWRRAGVPLRVVLRGIEDALESHAQSWSRHRRVGSLGYCRAEVESGAARWRAEIGGGAPSPAGEAGAALDDLAARLEKVDLAGGRAAEISREIAAALRRRARRSRRGPALERWLGEQERALVEALLEDAGPDARRELEQDLDAALARYRERLPAAVLDQVRAEARARRLLGGRGLPRLTLLGGEA